MAGREEKPALKEGAHFVFKRWAYCHRARTLLHHLYAFQTDYNPHWVDFKISRLRGTPLGCRRIHSLLMDAGDLCAFDRAAAYAHPLLHIDDENHGYQNTPSEKVENLTDALDNLRSAMNRVMVFMK